MRFRVALDGPPRTLLRTYPFAHVKLSVIIPAFNEEKNLDVLHTRLTGVLEKCAPTVSEFDLIFVNDGSRDGTLDGLRRERVQRTKRDQGKAAHARTPA